jgi:hypothetical protein
MARVRESILTHPTPATVFTQTGGMTKVTVTGQAHQSGSQSTHVMAKPHRRHANALRQ